MSYYLTIDRDEGGGGPTCTSGSNEVVFMKNLQPFDISNTSSSSSSKAFKSPGEEMEAALVCPFTTSQIKELERQALIYKYMVASVPIPPHLLQPSNSQLSMLSNMRFSKSGDLEPGRCKRTDGKKWRCAKDVAPNQKYCERHMNRGRPRSRKLVENQSPFNNNSNSNNKKICVLHHTNQDHESEVQTVEKSKIPIKHISAAAADAYNEPNWGLDREMDSNEQQCQQLIPAIFQRRYDEEPLNLISYKNLEGVYQNSESIFSLSPDLVSLNTLIPRGFIDAWSNENPNPRINEMSVPLHGNLSYSSLNLSMAMGSSVEDCVGDHKAQVSSWLSHDSCAGFMDGGPLGEVLRSSTGSMGSNPVSPYDISPTDSSVCNSPTPEIVGFQWFS